MKIPLTQGKFTIVDDIDYEYLMQWKWCYDNGYASRMSKKRKKILMHRVILERAGFREFEHSDHIDHNRLNNCRDNLRPATASQNQCNHRVQRNNNTSGFKGVSHCKQGNTWEARVQINGKRKYLGRFNDIIEAAKAYNKTALELHGEFAVLNNVTTSCLACASHITQFFFSLPPAPLMALNLPETQQEAIKAAHFPMNFYICSLCGHVYNVAFSVDNVPYEKDSNLMFNSGFSWSDHLESLAKKLHETYYTQGKTIIDIGAGRGGFLHLIKQKSSRARCVAFEPGIDSEVCRTLGLEVYSDYFVPQRDMQKFKPDILVCQHVLEHLQQPRDFVADIAHYAMHYPIMLVEVPCITKALNTHRITDFLYEHVSNFTQRSLQTMFENTGWETLQAFTAYNDEVAVWIGRPIPSYSYAAQAKDFREHTWNATQNATIHNKLDEFAKANLSVAFFGGAGKGAAFLNAYHLDGHRVIDSDMCKVGKHVPGTGQEIESVEDLRQAPVDVIIITTRWRAADISNELEDVHFGSLLVVENGQLVEYDKDMK